jgi:hypothetical protein
MLVEQAREEHGEVVLTVARATRIADALRRGRCATSTNTSS